VVAVVAQMMVVVAVPVVLYLEQQVLLQEFNILSQLAEAEQVQQE
jgi:hypothetical protein